MSKSVKYLLLFLLFLIFLFFGGFGFLVLGFAFIFYFKKIKKFIYNSKFFINNSDFNSMVSSDTRNVKGVGLRCAKCNSLLQLTDKFCPNCGETFNGDNVVVQNDNSSIQVPQKELVNLSDFDNIFSFDERNILDNFIIRELRRCGVDENNKLIPSSVLHKKKILCLIFSFLCFVYISSIFFHFPFVFYIVGLIILFIFVKLNKNYDLVKYLKKQVISRPNEKISNIVMNTKLSFVNDSSKSFFLCSVLGSVLLSLILFINPRIMYEKVENGYAVRFYTFGLTNFKSATIPEFYKNEKVVSLRGNTFSNMPFLEKVVLPDSITEIRGQAFKNCKNLVSVNIPSNLEYLGGGAFYNAKSITSIVLPDSLKYLGGESFYGASSLLYIKLSNKLTEIRGNSFENCTSLKSIYIPDSVTRIGGHAFYGDFSLTGVNFSENSKLVEIGSSAFRQCSSLNSIILPNGVSINERSFKESPTVIKYFDDIEVE